MEFNIERKLGFSSLSKKLSCYILLKASVDLSAVQAKVVYREQERLWF